MDGGERGLIGWLEIEYPLQVDVLCKTYCWESLRFLNDYDERKRYIDVPISFGSNVGSSIGACLCRSR